MGELRSADIYADVRKRGTPVDDVDIKACRPLSGVCNELDKDMHIEQAEVELGLGFEAEGNLYLTWQTKK